MQIVNFLAKLWGFSMIITCLALLFPKNVRRVFSILENQGSLFLIGLINTVLGIALILTYNIWDGSWRVFISLLAWLILARGLVVLFFPGFVEKVALKMKSKTGLLSFLFLIFIFLGCFLVYEGFIGK